MHWLGGACESRVLEEHREGKQRGESTKTQPPGRWEGPPRVSTRGVSLPESCETRNSVSRLQDVATRTASPRLPWLFE